MDKRYDVTSVTCVSPMCHLCVTYVSPVRHLGVTYMLPICYLCITYVALLCSSREQEAGRTAAAFGSGIDSIIEDLQASQVSCFLSTWSQSSCSLAVYGTVCAQSIWALSLTPTHIHAGVGKWFVLYKIKRCHHCAWQSCWLELSMPLSESMYTRR